MFEVGRDISKYSFIGGVENKRGHGRLRIVYYVFLGFICLFGLRTLYLGIQGTDRTRNAGSSSNWVVSRADIVDRNGDILAKNIVSGHIQIFPNRIKEKDKDRAANLIHQILPYQYSVSDALKLVNSGRGFMYLQKFASENQRKAVIDARIEGLEVKQVQTRKYPKRRLFAHAIGFVSEDDQNNQRGQEGAERTYDAYLRENTAPLRLSLDSRIQSVFYEQLSAAMQKYQAKSAMGMLMNSRTGEMLAMVSLPDFDPEIRNKEISTNIKFRPMGDSYEMGSIFKIFNTAMAMENGITKEYYVKEPFKIYDKRGRVAKAVHDVRSFKPPRPYLSVEEIMLHSCNVGSAQIALDLPDGTQQEFFHRLHFDEPLNLEFGRTARTHLPQRWWPVERATMSYGHGISVTPMHVLLAVNAMTNGGIYIYPTLQKRDVGAVHGQRVLSPEISARLRGIMLRVAEETSGRKSRVAGIQIGGKTATAEKYTNGRVDNKRNLTAYAAIFPAAAPQYVMLVILDEPHGTSESWGLRTAAWNVVPTTGKILDSILPLLFE